jgi:tetratricopeptide (TPR) repeat protein
MKTNSVLVIAALLSIPGAFGADSPPVPAQSVKAARQAKEQFGRGNYREAEKIYENILTVVPGNLYVLSNLGMVRYRSGKFALAIKTFRQALTVAPNDAFSHFALGCVYDSQKHYGDAMKEWNLAHKLDPAYEVPDKLSDKPPEEVPGEIPARFRVNEA